jgi:hypothetical protein
MQLWTEKRQEAVTQLSNGATLNTASAEQTALVTTRLVSRIEGLNYAIEKPEFKEGDTDG